MKSGRIEDSQITASDYIGESFNMYLTCGVQKVKSPPVNDENPKLPGNWLPHLARLDQSGYINAWMGQNKMSWLQVGHARARLTPGHI